MITSFANKGIKEVIQLEQKARTRRETGLFVAEGIKMFLEAPADMIRKVYVSADFANDMPGACRHKIEELTAAVNGHDASAGQRAACTGEHSVSYEVVSSEVFKKMSDTMTPQGILCVMKQSVYALSSMLNAEKPLIAVLEDIQDPGNLGTIFRAGEGAGVTGVIMSKDTVDIHNPKTIRSTMGSIYRMPFVYAGDLLETIDSLRQNDISVYAAHLQGAAAYDDCDYTGGCAFLIGSESKGLKDETAKRADARIRIPMLGKVESLNAAVAASVLFYEAARQRRYK